MLLTSGVDLGKPFSFALKTRVEFGCGCSRRLAAELEAIGASRVLLVTDQGLMAAGLIHPFLRDLEHHGITASLFAAVEANPRAATVDRAAAQAAAGGVEAIVAIGGGSSIDTAKGAAAVYSHGGSILDFEGENKLTKAPPPLIAVPTTAGTGSEVTKWAVITDPSRQMKMAVGDNRLAPDVALVDPELTHTLPPQLTAATGLDALTHAIEGYTALAANPVSDALGLHAVELVAAHLCLAVEHGSDAQARAGMMLASLLAGLCFGNSDTAAVHSMAEALGGVLDLPHGLANAICLPYVMAFNLEAAPARFARIAMALGADVDKEEDPRRLAPLAVTKVHELNRRLGVGTLRQLGVREDHLDLLAELASQNLGTPDNPRKIDKADFLRLFQLALAEADPLEAATE